ncbi:M48 family metallopeptidase [Pelagibius sp.]|uniref:tetratricopeptide repeat protein n=1 Tax=Pelagibius sp. TaxID=1931238 RepID=UPI002617019A|nr:tetratricopeptide repeat protein [Pelagibius sp.]
MDATTESRSRRLATKLTALLGAVALTGMLAVATAPAEAAGWSSNKTTTAADQDYVLAEKRIEAGDYQGAITLLSKLAERQPKNADVFNYLGFSNRKLGKFDEALVHYQRALFLDPKHRGAHAYLGELYLSIDELEKAEAELRELDALCFFGCEEYRELKAKIAAYKAQQAALPGARESVN